MYGNDITRLLILQINIEKKNDIKRNKLLFCYYYLELFGGNLKIYIYDKSENEKKG